MLPVSCSGAGGTKPWHHHCTPSPLPQHTAAGGVQLCFPLLSHLNPGVHEALGCGHSLPARESCDGGGLGTPRDGDRDSQGLGQRQRWHSLRLLHQQLLDEVLGHIRGVTEVALLELIGARQDVGEGLSIRLALEGGQAAEPAGTRGSVSTGDGPATLPPVPQFPPAAFSPRPYSQDVGDDPDAPERQRVGVRAVLQGSPQWHRGSP